MLRVAPIFLHTERHIRGLLVIVSMVLRLLTLVEFVTRRNLSAAKTDRMSAAGGRLVRVGRIAGRPRSVSI